MARPKSQLAQDLITIQKAVDSFLKPLGFRKKGRPHNRHTAGGLTHAVSFQMGQYPIGDHYVIPGTRERYYGKFWVNLGVLLPCVYQIERKQPPPDFVQAYDCTIRQRLGELAYGEDRSFDLASNIEVVAKDVIELLDRFGLDFLEQFQTYQDVLSHYTELGCLPFQNANRASLEAAIVAFQIGNRELSISLFLKAHAANHKGFQQHVTEIAKQLGLNVS